MKQAETIRHYQTGDLDSCRSLWIELTEWHREIYQAPHIGGDTPGRQFDEHLQRVGPANLWVAVVDERVVGLAGLIPGDGEAEIEPVVVSAPYRGAGLGRRLASTVIDAARKRGVGHLSVRPVARNERALRFFRRLGLDIVGHVELFTKLTASPASEWRDGPSLAGCRFRC